MQCQYSKKLTRAIILFCFPILSSTIASEPTTVKPLSKQAMHSDLDHYAQTVINSWSYLQEKKEVGVDVLAIADRLKARIAEKTNNADFADLLREFAAALKDGHSQAFVSHLKPAESHTWPIGFGLVKEGLIVINLNWLKANPGIKLGDRLVAVDDVPVEDYLRRHLVFTSASTDQSRRILTVDQVHFTNQPKVKFRLERENKTQVEFDLDCAQGRADYRFRQVKEFCSFMTIGDNIGLLHIPQFTWNEAAFSKATTDEQREIALTDAKRQIDRACAAAQTCRSLVLDLRGNSGGYELLSSYLAEHLLEGDFLYYTSTRRNSEFIRALPAYRKLGAEFFGQPIPNRPRHWKSFRHHDGPRFDKPIVVLINSRCFSTTDNLCALLKDSRPNTIFVGQPTGGGTGEPTIVTTLPHSKVAIQLCVSTIHSPKQRLIEGVGTIPDVMVDVTREDVLAGIDRATQVAKERLRQQ